MTDCLLKLCAHRAADGTRCKAPALRQSDHCRHHTRVHRPAIIPAYVFESRTIRDLQLALQRTGNDMLSGRITTKLAGQIFFELGKRIRALKQNVRSDALPRPQSGKLKTTEVQSTTRKSR